MTLVEMCVTIAVMTMVLTLISTVLVRLLRIESSTRMQIVHMQTLSRLADQFRQDIHQAQRVVPSDDNAQQVLRVVFDEQITAEYTFRPGQVARELLQGAMPQARESYRVPSSMQLGCQIVTIHDQAFAQLRGDLPHISGDVFEVLAAIGRGVGQGAGESAR
jgi:hypothetical protein